MPYFRYEGQRLPYTEFASETEPASGDAPGRRGRRGRCQRRELKPPGQAADPAARPAALSQEMHRPLAEALAARGNRVITVDLLGHGRSDRPRDMWRYSMATFGEQIVALMDHLGSSRRR